VVAGGRIWDFRRGWILDLGPEALDSWVQTLGKGKATGRAGFSGLVGGGARAT
jgi:hypothetical protein